MEALDPAGRAVLALRLGTVPVDDAGKAPIVDRAGCGWGAPDSIPWYITASPANNLIFELGLHTMSLI